MGSLTLVLAIVVVSAFAATAILAGLVIALVKLGVIAHYAVKPEAPADAGDYSLDQSQAPEE
jgi:hypothetical protein